MFFYNLEMRGTLTIQLPQASIRKLAQSIQRDTRVAAAQRRWIHEILEQHLRDHPTISDTQVMSLPIPGHAIVPILEHATRHKQISLARIIRREIRRQGSSTQRHDDQGSDDDPASRRRVARQCNRSDSVDALETVADRIS